MAAVNKKAGKLFQEKHYKKMTSSEEKDKTTGCEHNECTPQCHSEEEKKRALREHMISGYREMADINLRISEEFYAAEQELWFEN